MRIRIIHITIICSFIIIKAKAQISPGDLSSAHVDLEGILNCTKCHVLGGTVTDNKCLACHEEIDDLITQNKGYHASVEVKGKDCASCHSEHHGRNFELIRLEEDNFKHRLTGYDLTGKHLKIDCRDCHKPDLIANNELKKNSGTYLGLEQECLSCHTDYHQKSLSKDCASCHDTEAFSPAPNFNHDDAEFALRGKHVEVACVDCHQKETRNGQEFQRFVDIKFGNCVDCHEDPHNNKFGSNCAECHKEESFTVTKSMAYFDHDKTGFGLKGRHQNVDCKECHTRRFTDPLPHSTCKACHQDYHRGQLTKNGITPDCAECHTVNGFEVSLYSVEDHNKTKFPLEESHLATPCTACHKSEERWDFKDIGERCVDCHNDVHKGFIAEKYYPNQSCESCHVVTNWQENTFDHGLTAFELKGIHAETRCMDCHGTDEANSKNRYEHFQNLATSCSSCHQDVHNQQFSMAGVTDCATCHGFVGWEIDRFNHNKSRFKLEGKHAQIACSECHKEIEVKEEIFVQYKFTSFECVDCHQ